MAILSGGRLTGPIMLTVGVALFATFSGFLANLFLSPRKPEHATTAPAAFADIRALLEQQEHSAAQLRAEFERLEQAG